MSSCRSDADDDWNCGDAGPTLLGPAKIPQALISCLNEIAQRFEIDGSEGRNRTGDLRIMITTFADEILKFH